MKEQINRYARGAFEYYPLSIQISPEAISTNVENNKPFRGQIRIAEASGRSVKGIVYSSNDRVRLINDQFIGADNYIEFEVDACGLSVGDEITGAFYIVSNGGEEKLGFEFEVLNGFFDSEMGSIKNLFHFANLAQTDIASACDIFSRPDFNDIFLADDLKNQKLHDMLLLGSDIKCAVEEFLVAVNKKQKVTLSLSHTMKVFDDPQDTADTIIISKDTWGCCDITVWTDGDFIKLAAPRITEEAFNGGKLEYNYIIDRQKLHAGLNFASITFKTVYQELKCAVTVNNCLKPALANETAANNFSDSDYKANLDLENKRNLSKLVKTYLNFKLHKININDWITESKESLLALLKARPDDSHYGLVMGQVLITDKDPASARNYLDTYKDYAIEHKNDDPVLYCYYLYLNTIFMRDRAYAKETAAYVREVYEHECSDWRILWILLYLDEEMAKNKSLKLLRIKEQFNRGMRSPVLYLEACQILNDQPMLLRTLNDFELSVLLYGCKERILDKRLVSQICELVVRIDGKFSMLYRLLTYLYYYNESDSVLESLCTLLIRNGCTGRKYINWYELAIERELKITKLFEYYIESCEKNIEAEIPKMVLLYFSYDSFISDETKAYLFANIIHHKDVNAQIYRNYIPQMEEFTAEMLSKGKNDACLGILYREFFKPGMVNPHNIKNASDALFSNLITCENKNIVKVIVGHKEAEFEESFDLLNQCAVVPVFTEEPCICFEDRYGKRYANSIDYSMEKICEGESFAKSVFELLGDEAAGLELLTLLYCDKHRRIADNSRNMLRFYYNLSQNEDIRASYRKKLLEMVVDYYYDNFEGNEKDDLIDNLDIAGLGENYMAKYTETLIVHGYALEAFEESKLVRCDKLNPKRVLRLCERLAEDYESMESEDKTQFIKLAYYAFSKGKYSETTLDILILDFNKSTEQMTALWKAAVEYGLNTYPLDERIIVQMLFTGAYSSASENVFEHYYQVGANERVMEAYLAYNAYNYFVREAVVSESVFDIIEARFEADKDVILVCRLAYLKYLSEKQELGVSQKELAKLLLKALSRKGYIFAFYQKFADKIKLPYEIADKTIIEYRAQPGVKAVLHYIEEGSGKNAYSTCDMKNMFEGIFVKDFVLFYGDALQYFVTEEIGDEREATTARRIENTFIKPEHSEGRYDAINDIIACRQLHDSQTLDHLIKMYGVAEAVTEQLFKPI